MGGKREQERERERESARRRGRSRPVVSVELHGPVDVAARAVVGVCSTHSLKHRYMHWYRRRHMEYTCTQSAQTQTQAHMHKAQTHAGTGTSTSITTGTGTGTDTTGTGTGMVWHGMVDVCDAYLASEASGSSFG